MTVAKKGAEPRWVSEKDLGHGMLEVRLKKVDFLVDCFEIRLLRTMNINHATLFPDVTGAGLHANALLSVANA
jgi:hypothetical protein